MNKIFTPNLKFKLKSMKSEDAILLLFDKIQEFEKSLTDPSKHKVLDSRIDISQSIRK